MTSPRKRATARVAAYAQTNVPNATADINHKSRVSHPLFFLRSYVRKSNGIELFAQFVINYK
jgi:hypothetical protein